ncbi:hypothetical protein FC39_GL000458 [Lactobacillus hamsteri DSM 5661 = JCM 6256]|uniref:Phage protein n=1 Tax=Lactobacillus hamsteri DSM 5661 = JCM 6256 TaxID=1423754 RepID=A0A0R1Y3W4_9LACO|nr:hypothetical protein FC39_GL000458 [Lactobacillus hamsteri DSM 5661 = JCM 6256]
MHKRYDDLLKELTELVAMPDGDDEDHYTKVLKYVLSKAIQDVANYTNIPVDELPEELDYTIVSLTIQVIDTHGWLTPDNDQTGNVQSLSEGDTSVTFKSVTSIYSELQSVNFITDNYTNILNNFRRLPE